VIPSFLSLSPDTHKCDTYDTTDQDPEPTILKEFTDREEEITFTMRIVTTPTMAIMSTAGYVSAPITFRRIPSIFSV
jgi:hypothetical protein